MQIEATLHFHSDQVIFNQCTLVKANGQKSNTIKASYLDDDNSFIVILLDGEVLQLTEEGDVFIDQSFKVESWKGQFKWSTDVVINAPSLERIGQCMAEKNIAISVGQIAA